MSDITEEKYCMSDITEEKDDYQIKTKQLDYKPHITRDSISLYEFARVITDLANHLYELPNIEKYIDEIEVRNIIDPCTIAYRLLMEGKYNCLIDRGYEKVSFSNLKKNKNVLTLIESYLTQQESKRKHDIIDKLLTTNITENKNKINIMNKE